MDLDEVADELYGLPMQQFTKTRDTRAKQLASTGDGTTAAAVRKLRKPSQAAWLANQLARRHPQEMANLLALGRDLRDAQDHGHGADLRRLSSERQELSRRLLALAHDQATGAATSFTTDVQRQLVATIDAAMANEPSGLALQDGRLSEALVHVGFGGVQTTEPSPPYRPRPTGMGKGSDPQAQRDAGRRAFDEAERGLARAQEAFETATAALELARLRHQAAKVRQRQLTADMHKAEREERTPRPGFRRRSREQKREAANLRAAERERQRRASAAT